MSKEYVQLTTGRIACERKGHAGPDLVFLHSNSTSGDIFARQFAALGEKFRMTAIDLPGHGGSDDLADPAQYGLVAYAAIASAVLDRLGIVRPLLVGTSLGGHVVLEMTRSHPFAGAAIIGTPPFAKDPARVGDAYRPDPVAALSFVADLNDAEIVAYADALSDGHGHEPPWRGLVRRADPRMRAHLAAGLFAPDAGDQRHLAETCPGPLAIINGAEDRFVDLDYVDSLAYANLWSGRTYRIAGAGHAPFFSQPEAFNTILRRMAEDVFGA